MTLNFSDILQTESKLKMMMMKDNVIMINEIKRMFVIVKSLMSLNAPGEVSLQQV